jgi:glutamate synthase domain-containing protein 3
VTEIDAAGRATREVNAEIRRLAAGGGANITVRNPGARHNLAVAVLAPARIRIEGSAGYYCGGLNDGASIEILGSAGWGVAESMLSGEVLVRGAAGCGAAAALRGGTVVIHGDAAARAGVSMKGGLLLITGSCDYMAGFMAQKGAIVVCGDAGEAFADSMYSTVCYVGGRIAGLGADAVLSPVDESDIRDLESALHAHLPAELVAKVPPAQAFRKVISGRKLWNFDKREWKLWQEAL